jgi:uncharacterized sulfatase
MKLRLVALGLLLACSAMAAEKRKYNVLHIISDDLCVRIGCYGDPMVKTPNIDRLAARGVRFEHAYCQFPLCNPSRASFMTGLRPDITKVYENATQFRKNVPDAVSMPQSFQKAGYSVKRVGKIYHYGVPAQIGTSGLDDPASWDQFVNPKGRDIDDFNTIELLTLGADGKATTTKPKQLSDTGGTLSWLAAEGTDEEQTDGKGALETIKLLEENSKSGKPFYLAVGFYRPHTPYVAPKHYFEMYPPGSIKVPQVPANIKELFPAPALGTYRPAELAMDDDLKRLALQAYHGSTTFMDAQLGKVLDALDRLKLADDTIIVFQSDHGYHLGEKNLWQKMSIFEESVRVPLIIAVPGNKNNGKSCAKPVELVDLHKTLTDLCGIEADSKTQGYSLRLLLEDTGAKWDHPAYSQVTRGVKYNLTKSDPENKDKKEIMGRTIRTDHWRYTEWDEGRSGTELYDQDNDSGEWKNLANDPQQAKTVAELKELLHAGGK